MSVMAEVELDKEKEQLLQRLRRIEGQVRGIQRMVAEGRECEDVLTQLAAVRAALDRVGVFVISRQMRKCLEGAQDTEDSRALEKAFEVFLKYASFSG